MTKYNKLVRDNIPKIIESDGKEFKIRILNDEEYELELRKKLIEEAKELFEAESIEQKIYELADIYEIIEYVLHNDGMYKLSNEDYQHYLQNFNKF